MRRIIFGATVRGKDLVGRTRLLLGVVFVSWALVGCIALDTGRSQYESGQMDEPTWHLSSISEHVRFLANVDPAEIDESVRYVTDRLREYRVQPGLGARYRPEGRDGNMLAVGLIGGRNPAVSNEAVLVSVDITDQIATAAWLELARLQVSFARSGILPERSVIFVLWEGGEDGMREFLRSPPWLPSEITAWIYLHPPEDQDNSLQELARAQEWRYHFVYPDLAIPGEIQGPVARRLAERAHANIRAEVLSEGAFLPIRPHVLVAPMETDEPTIR